MKSDLLDISLLFHGETEKAIKVSEDGKTFHWLPKSQIEYEIKPDKTVEVTLPDWLYKDKGFIV